MAGGIKTFKNGTHFYSLMARKRFLSLNAMDKIMREAGAHRVSDSAKEALADALESRAIEISNSARNFAEHAGRKTITQKDIELAVKS